MPPDPIASAALAAIDRARAELVALSLAIHREPELGYQEDKASARIADVLRRAGFRVEKPYRSLNTALRADAGRGRPTIAILCEYDALPDIGHACGHNLMAMAGVAAGIGVRAVIEGLPGRVSVIGTPAEEGGGGKVALIENGGFSDVDAAMIVHPSSRTLANRGSLASTRVDIEFRGRAAHAAAQPDQGINALDGVILTFVGVNALRQQLRPDARVAGVITNGGSAANIVPELAAATFSVRAADRAYQQEVLQKFIRVAEGAATATGATVSVNVRRNSSYENMVPSRPLAERYAEHLRALGVDVLREAPDERMGSTDMGNVSQVLPAIHPYIKIAPDGTPGHSIAFRDAAATSEAHENALKAAKAMALLTIDLLRDAALMRAAEEEFESLARRGVVKGRLRERVVEHA
jgi:amidohydrolase